MTLFSLLKQPARLYYGWRMIALGSAIRILGGGLHLYGFTVFFLPLSQDLGLSRAGTSLAFSLARAEGAIESPVAGYLIDRFGPRPVMLTAVIMSGVGYILFAGVNSYFTFLLVYMGIVSLSFSAGFMHSPMVLANTWFIHRRALAMTFISASVGLGGALISPLLALSVQTWGWRRGALLAGIGMLVLGIPLAASVRRSPESIGLLPDGASSPTAKDTHPSTPGPGQVGTQEVDFTLMQAMRTSAFWMFILATMFRVAGLSTVMVHFIPIMVWKGLTEPVAALFLGTYAFLSLPSYFILGWIADRIHKPRLMGFTMVIATIALIVLIYGQSEASLWIFTVLITVAEALFPVGWATVGDFYGRKAFATIRGTMSFFYLWGGVAAPVVAGFVFDRTQSYGPMLWGLVVLFLAAAISYALMIRPMAR
jgi:sugar phosphate permease